MGAGASAEAHGDVEKLVKAASAKQLQEHLARVPAARRDKIRAALFASEAPAAASGEPAFELSTPMLVMPYATFKEQGRICKSVVKWRDEALDKGWLVEHAKVVGGSGKVEGGVLDGTVVVTEGKTVIFQGSHSARTPAAACALFSLRRVH